MYHSVQQMVIVRCAINHLWFKVANQCLLMLLWYEIQRCINYRCTDKAIVITVISSCVWLVLHPAQFAGRVIAGTGPTLRQFYQSQRLFDSRDDIFGPSMHVPLPVGAAISTFPCLPWRRLLVGWGGGTVSVRFASWIIGQVGTAGELWCLGFCEKYGRVGKPDC